MLASAHRMKMVIFNRDCEKRRYTFGVMASTNEFFNVSGVYVESYTRCIYTKTPFLVGNILRGVPHARSGGVLDTEA